MSYEDFHDPTKSMSVWCPDFARLTADFDDQESRPDRSVRGQIALTDSVVLQQLLTNVAMTSR
jgi:hypothetical protein